MGTIPTENIEQIAAANDIVEVIGSYFPLKRAGSSYKALCPFHQEKTPSFNVSSPRQSFHCFGCGAGGSVFRFVMDYEHLDFPSAVKKLAARAGIPVIEEYASSGGDDRQHEARRTLLQLHAEAAEWFHENLLKREWASAARDYLKRRGIDRQVAGNWKIGFAPDAWDASLKWALDRGYRRSEILQSGLVKPRDENRPEGDVYDRFRNRIMFPICNDVGEVIAFSGRVLGSDAETAKYLNSPETPLFRKGNVLFGLHKTKRAVIDAKSAIVCEGQLDLITLFEAGITNVVAPQGTAFTEHQARALKRYADEVVLCFDSDAAGKKAGERSLATFVENFGVQSTKLSDGGLGARGRGPAERSLDAFLQHDLIIRVAVMPPGQDPDSLIRVEGTEAFKKRIAEAPNYLDYWLDCEAAATDLSATGAKMQLARKLAETVARVHDPIMRGEVASKVSARIGVPPGDFAALLARPMRDRSAAQTTARVQPAVAPRHDIAMLCLLALRDPDARAFLLDENWREVLAQTPDSDMLVRILEGDLRPDDPPSINAFMSTLEPGEEALVAAWQLQRIPPNTAAVAKDWWTGLQQSAVRRQLQIAEGRMQIPQLSAGEMTSLQKQVVDLKAQLHELSAFSPPRVLDK
ncbi:MAG: DNA primase [Verrucomicrobiota bacterium]|nr:DNA primase [Verrucomicrobiota bacterium]